MEELVRGLVALGAAALVAISAWRLGALSGDGAVAATLVGGAVFGFAGLGPAVVLVLFFASSSALSALPGGGGRSRRGSRQVLANGAVAAVAAVAHGLHAAADLALLGAVAAAAADTWATELGVRLGKRPRSILSLRPRPPGASGAVSLPGTLGAVGGALAAAALGSWLVAGVGSVGLAAVAVGGFAGSLADSLAGAGLQAVYSCPTCGVSPEVARHAGCGEPAVRVAGVPGLDNDVVNWIATATGAGIAVLIYQLI